MTLWFACALVAAVVAATVFLPLARRRGEVPARVRYDRAIYRDQLAEIERDRMRGVLSEAESAAARTEIERGKLVSSGSPFRRISISQLQFCQRNWVVRQSAVPQATNNASIPAASMKLAKVRA